jgi:hypothetical protein
MNRDVPERRQEELRRRLQDYAATWRDDEFLDAMCDWADSGRRFTAPQADAIEESLTWWKRRLNGPSHDPDRCPPGYDQLTWDLATHFRQAMEARDLWCPSRREIYPEISRVLDRGRYREHYQPWRDLDSKPGWYRMMHDVITVYTGEIADADYPYSAHRQFAQPGVVSGIIAGIITQHKLSRFAEHAEPVNDRTPGSDRQAAVKALMAARNARGHR